jgi:translation initiation factor IF-3
LIFNFQDVINTKGSNKIGDRTIAIPNNSKSKDKTIMNEYIRSKEVRLIDENGENHGVVPTSKALRMAEDADLDLVLISPNQEPPVAKILDYGKYKYELAKKAKEAKKKQHVVEIKEVKMRYKIDVHDYEVRIKAASKFISQGNKVKGVVMLRGREMQHSNLAFDLANRFIQDMLEKADVGAVLEKKPQLEGRNVTFFLVGQSQQG